MFLAVAFCLGVYEGDAVSEQKGGNLEYISIKFLRRGRWAIYCNQHDADCNKSPIYRSVYMSVCFSVRSHITRSTCPRYTKF